MSRCRKTKTFIGEKNKEMEERGGEWGREIVRELALIAGFLLISTDVLLSRQIANAICMH